MIVYTVYNLWDMVRCGMIRFKCKYTYYMQILKYYRKLNLFSDNFSSTVVVSQSTFYFYLRNMVTEYKRYTSQSLCVLVFSLDLI